MDRLSGAGAGWVNVLPRIRDEEEARPTSLRFFTLFSGGGIGVTMATWIPAGPDQDQARLGVTHVTGRRAVTELAARSVELPAGWLVEQDHRRRGLVLRLPAGEPHEKVIEWALAAVRALVAPALVLGWRAEIYAAPRP